MNHKLFLKPCFYLILFLSINLNVNAQLQVSNNFPGPDIWGQVNPFTGSQSIGVGDFNSNSVWPQSALHINTNPAFMPASPTFSAGEVFRTDAPNLATYWRMLRSGGEYGVLFNNNDNHF